MANDEVRSTSNTSRIVIWLMVYALCYAGFHILPSFLNFEIKNRLMVAEVFDLFTPLVIILVVFKLYILLWQCRSGGSDIIGISWITLILIIGAVVFVEGHGIHLSANAIDRHLKDMTQTPLHALTYFFDEILGHILWDSGNILLTIGIVLQGVGIRTKKISNLNIIVLITAGLFFGFTYFVNGVEGQTVVFTFPMAGAMMFVVLSLQSRIGISLTKNPVLFFYFFGYLFATILFMIWWIWQGGFPEFSELGWI